MTISSGKTPFFSVTKILRMSFANSGSLEYNTASLSAFGVLVIASNALAACLARTYNKSLGEEQGGN